MAAAVILCLSGSAYAQSASNPVPRYGEPDKDKTPSQLEDERRSDAAYKRSLGNVPNAKAADPWGGVRSDPATKPAPAKKKSGTIKQP